MFLRQGVQACKLLPCLMMRGLQLGQGVLGVCGLRLQGLRALCQGEVVGGHGPAQFHFQHTGAGVHALRQQRRGYRQLHPGVVAREQQ
ncbi:MAG: hypothetical protein U1E74_05720 [Paenacidovorax caeni]